MFVHLFRQKVIKDMGRQPQASPTLSIVWSHNCKTYQHPISVIQKHWEEKWLASHDWCKALSDLMINPHPPLASSTKTRTTDAHPLSQKMPPTRSNWEAYDYHKMASLRLTWKVYATKRRLRSMANSISIPIICLSSQRPKHKTLQQPQVKLMNLEGGHLMS